MEEENRRLKLMVADLTLGPRRKQRKTAVEQLDAQYPGLQEFVDKQLNASVPVREIAPKVQQQIGVRIPERTLGSYRRRRWAVARWREEDEQVVEKVVEQLKVSYGKQKVMSLVPCLRYIMSLERLSPEELLRELCLRSERDLLDKIESELDLKSKA